MQHKAWEILNTLFFRTCLCVFVVAASHAHTSSQQQRVFGCLLHGEHNVVHCSELTDVRFSGTDCCFKVPFPQILN